MWIGDHLRLGLALVGVFALFQISATALGSDLGQAGLLVGALVVGATVLSERLLSGRPWSDAARAVGLGPPRARGMAAALAIGAALLAVIPAFLLFTSAPAHPRPGWAWLLPGLFAQGGIAEEALFRGLLFRRIREGRSFWRASALAALPFVAVHLWLLFTMPAPVALAAIALSTAISSPLAWLFELGGSTVWAPALLHFVIQGAIKLVVVPEEASLSLALVWMAASGLLPFLSFAVRRA